MKLSESRRGFSKSLAFLFTFTQLSAYSLLPAYADNSVRVAGSSVFSIPGSGLVAQERAAKVQSNIENSLVASSERGPSAVKITYVKGLPVISIGGYYVSTIDNGTAKAAGTTPSLLAEKWAGALKQALSDSASVDSYIGQLTGASSGPEPSPGNSASSIASAPAYASRKLESAYAGDSQSPPSAASSAQVGWQSMPAASSANTNAGYSPSPAQYAGYENASYQPASYQAANQQGPAFYQGRVAYIPAGMQIPVKLATALSSQVAKPGDLVIAKTTETVTLGGGLIPADTVLTGQVTEASDGTWMGRSGRLGIKFKSLRTPNGVETPISAHIAGNVGKYVDKNNDTFAGENTSSKIKKSLVATAIGAGGGSALGVAVGAISGGGRGVGKGAWSGAAIGAGAGLVQSLLLRQGSEVNLQQGAIFNLQLDAPVTVAMN